MNYRNFITSLKCTYFLPQCPLNTNKRIHKWDNNPKAKAIINVF